MMTLLESLRLRFREEKPRTMSYYQALSLERIPHRSKNDGQARKHHSREVQFHP